MTVMILGLPQQYVGLGAVLGNCKTKHHEEGQASAIYNVEEDPTDPAPPWLSPLLSPSNPYTIIQLELDELELELDELEGPLLLLDETLVFALDVANEEDEGYALRRVRLLFIAPTEAP